MLNVTRPLSAYGLYHNENIRTYTQHLQQYYAYLTHYKGVFCILIGQEFHFGKFRSV